MNPMEFKILEPAEIEIDDAFDYYEYELPGLGQRFLAEFRNGIKRILAHPCPSACMESDKGQCKEMYIKKISLSYYLCN